jgi:hypothetical protein
MLGWFGSKKGLPDGGERVEVVVMSNLRAVVRRGVAARV